MKCDSKYMYRDLKQCPNEATKVIHLMNGGKDVYVCDKHYKSIKDHGVLDNLIEAGRVEDL